MLKYKPQLFVFDREYLGFLEHPRLGKIPIETKMKSVSTQEILRRFTIVQCTVWQNIENFNSLENLLFVGLSTQDRREV